MYMYVKEGSMLPCVMHATCIYERVSGVGEVAFLADRLDQYSESHDQHVVWVLAC